MLILSRHIFEKIIVRVPGRENPIVIQLTDIRDGGKKARIGVTADADIVIDREEVDLDKRSGNGSPRRPYR